MQNRMLVLHVTYTVKAGEKENFVAAVAAAGIDAASRAEAGCVRYDYFYAAQAENAVLLVEVWDNVEAQAAHTQTEHFQRLAAIKERYVLQTAVQKYIGE